MGFEGGGSVGPRDLLAELQHRMRNTLATTRLIARRSAETSDDLEDYVAHLDGRLAALARVQNLAIRDPLAGIDLGVLVTDEITGAGLSKNERIVFSGPEVPLHPRAAEPFALAIHELMTNAIKFGALSTSYGRLNVVWQIEDAISGHPVLRFEWTESGIRLDRSRRKLGFGTIVLTEMLTHTLGATALVDMAPTGLICRMSMELTDRIVLRQRIAG